MKTIRSITAVAALVLMMAALVPAQSTRTIHGQVVDRGGAPLPKAVVYLKNVGNLQMRTYIADDSGAFHFQNLNADANYEVHAEHDGAASDVKRVDAQSGRAEVQLTLRVKK